MATSKATLPWLGLKLRKRVVSGVCRRLYRDREPGLDRTVLVAGCARSGTTWLADLIARSGRCRVLFEPFYSERVAAFATFERFPYRRPDDDDSELRAFSQRILSGRIRDPWIDSRVTTLAPRFRVVKEIRANLFLKWLHDRFPSVPLVFLLRHPCAVVASRLRAGWSAHGDLRDLLSQDELVEDFVAERFPDLDRVVRPEEQHAAIWCIQNLVPLAQFAPGSLAVVYYERLCRYPAEELRKVGSLIGRELGPKVVAGARRPSATVGPDSAVLTGEDRVEGWRSRLTPEQAERVLRLVDDCGLGFLYDDSSMPLTEAVASGQRSLRS